RFENPDWVRDATHGLIARAHVRAGQLDRALAVLAQGDDVETTLFERYRNGLNLELWVDIARLHAASGHYGLALRSYELLARRLGACVGDRDLADTTRLRFYWLQRMAVVVHEMASVWLAAAGEVPEGGEEAVA